jgi:hypothetical protein
MYFAIWWVGVRFAESYIKGEDISLKSVSSFAGVLLLITILMGLNLYIHYSYTKFYSYPLVAYPFIELRHFTFSLVVLYGAVIWKNLHWKWFNQIFGIFKHIAPCSYVIYISHHYLVVEASYLSFIDNKIIEYTLYILLLIVFSYFLEVVLYNKIRKLLIG